MTRHFELLNYSEFGTTVDNVLYSCDFSDKPATTPQPSPVVAAVREIIGKNSKKDKDKEREEQQTKDKRYIMSARSREVGLGKVRKGRCRHGHERTWVFGKAMRGDHQSLKLREVDVHKVMRGRLATWDIFKVMSDGCWQSHDMSRSCEGCGRDFHSQQTDLFGKT